MQVPRLPRAVFWCAGAAIALAGAVGARLLGEMVPDVFRVPVWLSGAGLIFAGLAVLSLGSRAHRQEESEQEDGAGEGNRTLA